MNGKMRPLSRVTHDTGRLCIGRANHRAVTAVVCVALAAVVAAMSSLNVALPDIARSTHADETQLTWIIDAYSLCLRRAAAAGGRHSVTGSVAG